MKRKQREAMNEEWKAILGWEGLYEVSNLGRVRSRTRRVKCAWGMRTATGRVVQPRSSANGYLRVALRNGGFSEEHLVHRLVARHFVCGYGAEVRHLDGDKSNNAAWNLAWGSRRDNEADKAAHGTKLFGERHPRSTLTDEVVREIRRLHSSGLSQLAIAKALGIRRGPVGTVVRGEGWSHVE